MNHSSVLLLCCLAASLVAGDAAADWPAWRGPSANGFAAGTGLNADWKAKAPKELWRAKLSSAGFSGISAAGGSAFIVDHDGKKAVVRAFALASGKEVWRFAFDDGEGENFGFDRATPAIDGGMVYRIGRLGQVVCLNAKTGAQVWTADYGRFGGRKPNWNHTASPVVDGANLVVLPGSKDGLIQLLDKKTGKPGARLGGDEAPSYATPVVATINGVKQYVVFSAKRIAGIDAAKGMVLWQHPWSTAHDVNSAAPLVNGNAVFITSGYGHGCAMLDIGAGGASVRWENKEMQSHFSSPILADGCIYGSTDPGRFVCLDAKTGAVKWQTSGFSKGGVVAFGKQVVAVDADSGDAALIALDPAAFKELGRIKPFARKGQYWSPPIIADGRLLLRGSDEIVCYDLK